MRVLMVEDEVRLAETVSRGLVAEGFVVDIVHDGADGLLEAQVREYFRNFYRVQDYAHAIPR